MSTMMQMPLVAPLFIEDRNFTSTLVMANGSSTATYADVLLTGLDGRKIAQQRISFAPHSQQRLEIRDALQAAGSTVTTGSLTLTQSPDLKGMAILAQLSITYRGSPESSYIDEELAMPSSAGSQTLRAAADAGDGSPLLAITSLTESLQHVSVRCIDDGDQEFSKTVGLAAGETIVTEACSPQLTHRANFETVLENENGRRRGAVGIELLSDAMPGSFAAFGLVPHGRQDNRFFSEINFVDPKMVLSITTVFAGVPVGPSTLLPEGKYVPQVTLANFSTKDANVHVKYSYTSGTSPTVQDVASAIVPARSTKALTLQNLPADPGLQNSFLIVGDGSPGDLVVKLDSTSESELREVELPGKDAADLENGGVHPWSLDSGGDSTLLLFNHGAEPHYFNVIVSAGAVLWQKAYQLSAMQTLAVSIGDLIQNRVQDDKGQILPQDVQSGQVGWFATAVASGKGRVLQSNRETAVARSFSCGDIYVVCGAQFSPGATTFSVGDNGISFGTVQPTICLDQSGMVDCTGTVSDLGGNGDSYQWTSQDTSIISINQPATGQSVTVNGVAVGSAFVDGTVTDAYGCTANAGTDGLVLTVTITDADLENNNVNVTLGGPSTASGTLTVTANGKNNTVSVSANGGSALGPGQYTVSFNRPTMAVDTYSSVTAQWNVGGTGVSQNLSLSRVWDVRGTVTHTQYNSPSESNCAGANQVAYIYNPSNCTFTQVLLKSDFMSQVVLNGTGTSGNYGLLSSDRGQCSNSYPPGANSQNSFFAITSITGACGTQLAGGDSVATNPNPAVAGNLYVCGDNLLIVNSSNVNVAIDHAADYCPGCDSFHFDHFSSSTACSLGSLPDNWAADTH